MEIRLAMRQLRLFPSLVVLIPILTGGTSALCQTTSETQHATAESRSQPPKWKETDERKLLAKAQQGDADSQMWLGCAYGQGWFGKANFPAALKWFRRSAEQGNPDAQNSLGQLYEDGRGVAQSYVLAVKWYRRAAEHVPDLGGAGQGRNNLGLLYLDGRGVPKDYIQAYMWFKLSFPHSSNLSFAAAHMTAEQIAEAERLAAWWNTEHAQPSEDAFHEQ